MPRPDHTDAAPPPLSADETQRLLLAMRQALPAADLEHVLGLELSGPTPLGAPDNVRYLYAQHGRRAELPTWFVAKYSAFLSE
jgi:hypothetical protein